MTAPPPGKCTIEFEVRCPVSGPTLAVIRAFVETVARQIGFDMATAAQIEMAVDEACSNVWLHAYPDSAPDDDRLLTLRLTADSESICIIISDHGIGALEGEDHHGCPSISEYMDKSSDFHGLGTLIIRSFMDEVEYRCPPRQGTLLRMKKYLRAPKFNGVRGEETKA